MSHRQISDSGLFADDGVWFTTLGPHRCFALLGHWHCCKREDIQNCLLVQVIDNHVCKVHEFPDTCQCFHIKPGAVQILVSNKSHASPTTQQQSQVYWIKYSHGPYSSPRCSDPFRWAQASSQELAAVCWLRWGRLTFLLVIPSEAQVAIVFLMPLKVGFAQGRK